MADLEYLFRPISVGTLKLANRIVMPPMATNYGTAEGYVTDRLIAYLVERVRGGAGYVTTEHITVGPEGRASPNMLCLFDDSYVPGFKRLTEAIHEAGGKVVFQLNHGGRQASSSYSLGGKQLVAPSAIPCPARQEMPRAFLLEELPGLVRSYVDAAVRAKEAGADGVELHMAHGYLLMQFLSPFSNRRTDEYGGSLEGRVRLPLEVLRGAKEALGSDYPVICRLSVAEYVQGGLEMDEGVEIARLLEANGADAIHVSASSASSRCYAVGPYYQPRGVFLDLAEAVKEKVSVPVICVGRINDPLLAEEVLRGEKADLVSFGRALLADPYLPVKAREGRLGDVIPCVACNQGCIEMFRQGKPITCVCNPRTGAEVELDVTPAARPKKVMVIGGGPAGMQAALVAAERGHQVSLWEQADELGGNYRVAGLPPGKEELRNLVSYFEQQLAKSTVRVERGAAASAETVRQENPDAVVVATGASPAMVPVEGLAEAIASGRVVQAVDVLTRKVTVGRRVVVVGGGTVGLETADALAEEGCRVTVLEMLPAVGEGMVGAVRMDLVDHLQERGVELRPGTAFRGLEGDVVSVESDGGLGQIEGVETVVLAAGFTPRRELADKLRRTGKDVYVVGDAEEPRTVMEAVEEAYRVALKI